MNNNGNNTLSDAIITNFVSTYKYKLLMLLLYYTTVCGQPNKYIILKVKNFIRVYHF